MPYHAHNDYLQVLAETGIIGLLLYTLVFIYFLKGLFRIFKNPENKQSVFVFSSLLFVVIYVFDASFNFPYARPIMQIFLLFIIAISLAGSINFSNDTSITGLYLKKLPSTIFVVLILASPLSIYSNYRVLNSLIQQDPLLADFNTRSFSRSDDFIKSVEVDYPSIGVTALPLKAMLANYYSSKDPQKAISLALASSKDNPHTFLGEIIASRVYKAQNKLDSAKYYSKLAFEKTPTIELSAVTYIPFITRDRDTTELNRLGPIIKNSQSKFIWSIYFESLYQLKDSLSEFDKNLLEIGTNKFPDFINLKLLNLTKEVSVYDIEKADYFAKQADKLFDEKKYLEAIGLYKKAQALVPKEPAYQENQARAYMLNGDLENAVDNFRILINDYQINNGFPEFYIGAILSRLDKKKESCENLNISLKKGYNPAKKLLEQLCID